MAFGNVVQSFSDNSGQGDADIVWGTDASEPTSGNLLLIAFGDRSNGTATPAGYTELLTRDPWSNSGSTRSCIYAKIAGASETDLSLSVSSGRPIFMGVEVEGPFESLAGLAILDKAIEAESSSVSPATGIATGTSGTLSQAENFAFVVVMYRGTGASNDDPTSGSHTDGFTNQEYVSYIDDFIVGGIAGTKVTSATTALNPTTTWTTASSNSFDSVALLVVLKKESTGGYSLTAAAGSFTLTGQTAGLSADRTLAAAVESFVMTGNAAGLLRGYRMTAEAAAITLAGQDAGFLAHRTIAADVESFALTGNDAGLITARTIAADAGSFALTGNDATLTYTTVGAYAMTAEPGSFALTGNVAGLLAGRTIGADAGSFALTGIDTGLNRGYSMATGAGVYTLTGNDIAVIITRLITASVGAFTLTGIASRLAYSGEAAPSTPGSRTVTVSGEYRVWTADDENRTFAVSSAARTHTVGG